VIDLVPPAPGERVQDGRPGRSALPLRPGSASRRTDRRGLRRRRRNDARTAILMLLPAVAIIGTFVAYPIVSTGYLSLTSWDGFSDTKPWVGLDNYRRLWHDDAFRNSLWVTILYGLGVCVLSVVTGLGLALLLNGSFRLRGLYRTVFFLPVVTSSIAAATVWRYLFDVDGLVNRSLGGLGIPATNWLGEPRLALVSLILLTVWKNLGLNVVLYLTALQTLPAALFEAAAIDGASRWQRVRHLVVPLLAPMTFFVVLEGLITSFQSFDLVYALTGGGPLGGTETLGFLTYREAFRLSHFGYGASVAYAAFALVLGVTLIQWRLGGRERWGT
jgi:multiple sugar transport system permease protein